MKESATRVDMGGHAYIVVQVPVANDEHVQWQTLEWRDVYVLPRDGRRAPWHRPELLKLHVTAGEADDNDAIARRVVDEYLAATKHSGHVTSKHGAASDDWRLCLVTDVDGTTFLAKVAPTVLRDAPEVTR